MEPNRKDALEPEELRSDARPDEQKLAVGDERADDLEGQLGPDELPDADEVARTLEAKRHQ